VGLFTGLITLPLAPVRGVAWLGEQVLDQATQEGSDPEQIRQQLAELEEAEAAGEITAPERAEAEERLIAELMRAREGGGYPPGLAGARLWPMTGATAMTADAASATSPARSRRDAARADGYRADVRTAECWPHGAPPGRYWN
jgi:gas vesicle protein GvpG